MTNYDLQDEGLLDLTEEEFRHKRDEVCEIFLQSESTHQKGQLTRFEYVISVVVLVLSVIGILIFK